MSYLMTFDGTTYDSGLIQYNILQVQLIFGVWVAKYSWSQFCALMEAYKHREELSATELCVTTCKSEASKPVMLNSLNLYEA